MAELSRSPLERRAEAFTERRYHSVDRGSRLYRFAGDLFNVNLKEQMRKNQREARQRLQRERPTGIGFGTDDNYGPDDNWSTRDEIKETLAPSYYKNYGSY